MFQPHPTTRFTRFQPPWTTRFQPPWSTQQPLDHSIHSSPVEPVGRGCDGTMGPPGDYLRRGLLADSVGLRKWNREIWGEKWAYLVGGDWNILFFHIVEIFGNNHSNWRSYFSPPTSILSDFEHHQSIGEIISNEYLNLMWNKAPKYGRFIKPWCSPGKMVIQIIRIQRFCVGKFVPYTTHWSIGDSGRPGRRVGSWHIPGQFLRRESWTACKCCNDNAFIS